MLNKKEGGSFRCYVLCYAGSNGASGRGKKKSEEGEGAKKRKRVQELSSDEDTQPGK